jgi:hypothetical protein
VLAFYPNFLAFRVLSVSTAFEVCNVRCHERFTWNIGCQGHSVHPQHASNVVGDTETCAIVFVCSPTVTHMPKAVAEMCRASHGHSLGVHVGQAENKRGT